MSIINKYKKYLFNPKKLILPLGARGFLNWLSDRKYLEIAYWARTGKKLNLENPTTYNEKLQWLKLYDRNPEYTIYADKYAVRQFIKDTIGGEYLIPLLGVYNGVEEIKWDKLPNQFVLKCSHASGANIICSNKTKLNIDASKKKLKRWMKKNWFWFGREWCYKNIKPRIICEKYMVDESGKELKDYKIFCFNGEPRIVQVGYDRFIKGYKKNLYDTDWSYIPVSHNYPTNPNYKIDKPKKLNYMLKLAQVVSSEHPFVRIDFYSIETGIYFGEITFYPASGFGKFTPESYDKLLGSWINLPDKI
jgi:hypothetical protein